MITYRYASSPDGKIFDVLSLNDDTRRYGSPYSCLGCDAELIPNIPKTNKSKYFSHKIKGNCSRESYLHRLAKDAFYESYSNAVTEKLPFTFTYRRDFVCNFFESTLNHICNGTETASFDLTKAYTNLTKEEKFGDFIPDVTLLSEKHPPIFIEIVVTHKASRQKIESGAKIIEIYISSEDDIQPFIKRQIFQNSSNVITHNIKGKPRTGPICAGQCDSEASFFVADSSGKAKIITEIPSVILARAHQFKILSPVLEADGGGSHGFQTLLANLRHHHFSGKSIRNCLLCKHQGIGEISGIMCRVKNTKVFSSEAVSCQKYAPYRDMSEAKSAEKRNLDEHIEKSNKLVEKMLRGYR